MSRERRSKRGHYLACSTDEWSALSSVVVVREKDVKVPPHGQREHAVEEVLDRPGGLRFGAELGQVGKQLDERIERVGVVAELDFPERRTRRSTFDERDVIDPAETTSRRERAVGETGLVASAAGSPRDGGSGTCTSPRSQSRPLRAIAREGRSRCLFPCCAESCATSSRRTPRSAGRRRARRARPRRTHPPKATPRSPVRRTRACEPRCSRRVASVDGTGAAAR